VFSPKVKFSLNGKDFFFLRNAKNEGSVQKWRFGPEEGLVKVVF
jgi:hypothetical protein